MVNPTKQPPTVAVLLAEAQQEREQLMAQIRASADWQRMQWLEGAIYTLSLLSGELPSDDVEGERAMHEAIEPTRDAEQEKGEG